MSKDTWRLAAARAIDAAVKEGRSKGLDGRELRAYISKRGYPFGKRAHYPYRVWLAVMRRRFPYSDCSTVESEAAWDAMIKSMAASFGAAREEPIHIESETEVRS